MVFYNDNDRQACAWLRELGQAGLLPEGVVDERSIADIRPVDLAGHEQCHFFAGIGGWPLALQLAGWPAGQPVWTGSCPCQPFSAAGKRQEEADTRDLWPHFFRLITECRPSVVFGEQVAGDGGYRWLSRVHVDLESQGYSLGAADLPAACVGSPHIRQRLFWVAKSMRPGQPGSPRRSDIGPTPGGGPSSEPTGQRRVARGVFHPTSNGRGKGAGQGRSGRAGAAAGFWADSRIIQCLDGKARRIPVEPLFLIMADGFSRLLGNLWADFATALKSKVVAHAAQTKTSPREVLRAMWQATAQEAMWQQAGGSGHVPEASLLLVALCEFTGRVGAELFCTASDFGEISQASLRVLRGDWEPARSPHQRGLDGSPFGEPQDSVCSLPLAWTQSQAEGSLSSLRATGSESRDVPEALSAMAEVWRPLVEQAAKTRNIQRLRGYAMSLIATGGFPLAHGVPGRVGLLRGAGNAIVPEVAALFVRAFLEVKDGMS